MDICGYCCRQITSAQATFRNLKGPALRRFSNREEYSRNNDGVAREGVEDQERACVGDWEWEWSIELWPGVNSHNSSMFPQSSSELYQRAPGSNLLVVVRAKRVNGTVEASLSTTTIPWQQASKAPIGIEAALWLLRFCDLILTAKVWRRLASFKARSTCQVHIKVFMPSVCFSPPSPLIALRHTSLATKETCHLENPWALLMASQ